MAERSLALTSEHEDAFRLRFCDSIPKPPNGHYFVRGVSLLQARSKDGAEGAEIQVMSVSVFSLHLQLTQLGPALKNFPSGGGAKLRKSPDFGLAIALGRPHEANKSCTKNRLPLLKSEVAT